MGECAFLQRAAEMLIAIGYEMQPGDELALHLAAQVTAEEIRNECNLREVPEGLTHCAAAMTVGKFLMMKKLTGTLAGLSLDLSPAVKQLQEGDTTVVWAVEATASPEQRLDAFIAQLLAERRQLVSFRRLAW